MTAKPHACRAGGALLGGMLPVRRAAYLRSQRAVLERAAQGAFLGRWRWSKVSSAKICAGSTPRALLPAACAPFRALASAVRPSMHAQLRSHLACPLPKAEGTRVLASAVYARRCGRCVCVCVCVCECWAPRAQKPAGLATFPGGLRLSWGGPSQPPCV